MMSIDSYELKANVTTFLTVVIFPFLTANGVADATANQLIGVLSYFIVLIITVYGERFISKIFTKENPNEVNCDCGSDSEIA